MNTNDKYTDTKTKLDFNKNFIVSKNGYMR